MQKIPQVVRERLKAGSVNNGHPDADVLTAFGEQSLSARQRGEVLEHLARCSDCREIVALALPPIEEVQKGTIRVRGWFSWTTFRWASVTAGIAILAVGGLQYHARLRPPRFSVTLAKRVTEAQPMEGEKQVVPSATVPVTPKREQHLVAGNSVAAKLANKPTRQAPDASGSRLARKSREEDLNPPMQGSQQGPVAAQSLPAPAAKEAVNGRNVSSLQTLEVQSQSEMVQVEPQVAKAEAPPSVFDDSSRPVGKAKAAIVPALQTATGNALLASRWSITPTGGLQRSFDQGNTWQDVDVNAGLSTVAASSFQYSRDDSLARKDAQKKSSQQIASGLVFRTIAVNGADVWAGGSNAALYHSTDSGDHWVRVIPSISGTLMSGDVVSLEFPTPENGSITTSSGEIWSTNDRGQSWTKR